MVKFMFSKKASKIGRLSHIKSLSKKNLNLLWQQLMESLKKYIHTNLIGPYVYISRISALIGIDNRKLSLVLHIKAE